ncbi:MAG: ATP-binding protein [Prevotella sp.]|nr:ATP-binding protein [Prevotella sp.]
MATLRKYPVGIQSFEKIRTDGYIYIDKTPLIYKMITEGCPYFLSRPRRFGKSLLCSTLEAVFQGRRELFEAFTTKGGIEQPQLFITTTDWEWQPHPVIRFDFSKAGVYTLEVLDNLIDDTLSQYEREYGLTPQIGEGSNTRFISIITEAHRQTGRRAVVLVDEYDTFMLHSIGNSELEEGVRTSFSSLFSPLKALDDHLQFVFITGISKFSQMGIFSTLNNLKNISMSPLYESLCGITEEELTTFLRKDIERLAENQGETYDATFSKLKRMYDGYHFCEDMTDIYNPFSLFNAFDSGRISDYWFDSATPSAVIGMLAQMPPVQLTDIDGVTCPAEDFDTPFNSYANPIPVLYQSGYITIKDYDREYDEYTLGLPNFEVRKGFANSLYQYVVAAKGFDTNKNALYRAYNRFRRSDELPPFIEAVKVFFAGIPYYLNEKGEHHYDVILYTLLTAFGADVIAEEPSAKGRADIILKMAKGIYVIEIKYDDTADEALKQIDQRGYADKYRADGRPITKVGIAFSSKERNITEYKFVREK